MRSVRAVSAWAFLLASLTIGRGQIPIPLANIKAADSTIVVELRYAGSNNIAGRPLYPKRTRAMIQPDLIPRLKAAQKFLRQFDYRLKIWDAYRPPSAQRELWRAIHNDNYVANPDHEAGSLHSWGVALDSDSTDLHNPDARFAYD